MSRVRVFVAMAIMLICHSHFAVAACGNEINNAQKIAARIENEWALRPNQDNQTRYIQKIADQLVPAIKLNMGSRNFNWPLKNKWRFLLIRDLSVNAYSVGNGQVYITDGTYGFADSEAELAAIIAHEMAHELIGHFCDHDERLATHSVGSFGQVMDNARELEADALAVEILQYADYSPYAMLAVLKKLPVPKTGISQKNLRIKALQRQLGNNQIIPFSASPEFIRIKHEAGYGNRLHK